MSVAGKAYGSLVRRCRVLHYRMLSENSFSGVRPSTPQPVLFAGKGVITFQGKCLFGWSSSPGFHNTYAYIEAREADSRITFGDDCYFNNNFQVIAYRGEVRLGNHLRVGLNCAIVNSDFHNLDPEQRNMAPFAWGDVIVQDDVFIGNNVLILKGVVIGCGATIGSGSVVTSNIPDHCVAAGVPAKVIKQLADDRL